MYQVHRQNIGKNGYEESFVLKRGAFKSSTKIPVSLFPHCKSQSKNGGGQKRKKAGAKRGTSPEKTAF